jgi:MoxR-like ATPase
MQQHEQMRQLADSTGAELHLQQPIEQTVNPNKSLTNEQINDGLRAAFNLGTEGKKQINEHVLIGEDEAVDATQAAQLMGGNLHYVSKHGGGKTKILRFGHLIIDGINKVATTPARADLTGGEFSGTSLPLIISETDNEGRTTERSIENTARGIVNAGTQVLNLNELLRISPSALSSGLEIMESRELETGDGILSLNDLEYIVATSNPFTKASRGNQFRAHGAAMSRFQLAVLMGDEKYWEDITEKISLEQWKPTPELIEPVITLPELHLARKSLEKGIIFAEPQARYLQRVAMSAARVLNENNAEELPGRINVHILETAKALTALKGEVRVSDETINKALDLKATAIIVGLRPKDDDDIRSMIDTIKERAV